MKEIETTRKFRSVWISDLHLGTRGCKAELLLEFLKSFECETLYLVGDIIDVWALKRGWSGWSQTHNDVVQKILRKARKGTEVILVPGNHDEKLREFSGMRFGGVAVVNKAVHMTSDGRRLLVTHGDQYDAIMLHARWLAHLGSWAYDASVIINYWLNGLRRRLGLPYWSLSGYLKRRVKNAHGFVDDFKRALCREARERGLDGVVCGHVHWADACEIDGIAYYNDGDWVDSCTALVEHPNGRLELLHRAVEHAREAAAA
jgi:UDP-2,3-diacylglucosamine pyrophosphatase LpxH